jgi:phage gp36-like protein
MAYSTVAKIREEAGFTDNTNITNARVEDFQSIADSHIDGVLSRSYTLPLESTPAIIELLERKLAAGYLLLEEYGSEAEGTGKDGQAKIDFAEKKLNEIESGYLLLTDSSGTTLARATRIGMRGFPNSSTGTDKTTQGSKDDPPIIEIGMKF